MQLKIKTSRFAPFLSKESKYKVIGFWRKQPKIVDNTGVVLRLNLKKDYQIIK